MNDEIKLLQGDCIELLEKIPEHTVNSIITDPPYFLGMTHNGYKGAFNDLAICKPFYEKLFNEYKRVLKPDGCVYFFTDWRGYAFYYSIFEKIIGVNNLLVWTKHGRPSLNSYGFGYELIIFHGKIITTQITNVITNIKSFNIGARKTNGVKVHPTQKPIELIEKFILDSTNEGDLILDTFMGSGTTGAACIKTDRRFIGMEIDEEYFSIAKARIADAIKEKQQDLFYQEKGAVNE